MISPEEPVSFVLIILLPRRRWVTCRSTRPGGGDLARVAQVAVFPVNLEYVALIKLATLAYLTISSALGFRLTTFSNHLVALCPSHQPSTRQ